MCRCSLSRTVILAVEVNQTSSKGLVLRLRPELSPHLARHECRFGLALASTSRVHGTPPTSQYHDQVASKHLLDGGRRLTTHNSQLTPPLPFAGPLPSPGRVVGWMGDRRCGIVASMFALGRSTLRLAPWASQGFTQKAALGQSGHLSALVRVRGTRHGSRTDACPAAGPGSSPCACRQRQIRTALCLVAWDGRMPCTSSQHAFPWLSLDVAGVSQVQMEWTSLPWLKRRLDG
ncbi:hypothetical protein GGR57DRAFT_90915 [Xylariaceae sp. FL1272]|nr:hypothetical protein GGR57DRAFT_90915 [Xylariaceae sp. FL1272]